MFNFQTYSSATLIVKTKFMVAIIYHVHNTSLDNMKSLLSLREIFNWPLSETWDYIGFIYMWYVHTDLTRKPWPTPQPIWWITNLGQSFFSWGVHSIISFQFILTAGDIPVCSEWPIFYYRYHFDKNYYISTALCFKPYFLAP